MRILRWRTRAVCRTALNRPIRGLTTKSGIDHSIRVFLRFNVQHRGVCHLAVLQSGSAAGRLQRTADRLSAGTGYTPAGGEIRRRHAAKVLRDNQSKLFTGIAASISAGISVYPVQSYAGLLSGGNILLACGGAGAALPKRENPCRGSGWAHGLRRPHAWAAPARHAVRFARNFRLAV